MDFREKNARDLFNNFLKQLALEYIDKYKMYRRTTTSKPFDQGLQIVGRSIDIQHTRMKAAVRADQRLAITLRFFKSTTGTTTTTI